RRQANFVHLTSFERRRIVGLREGGFSFRQIAIRVERSAPEPAEEPQHQKITSSEYWLSERDSVQFDPLKISEFTIGYVQWAYVFTVRVWFFHRHKIMVANVWSGALNVGIGIISSDMRLQSERGNLAFAIERHVHHTIGIMVWCTLAYGSISPLHLVRGIIIAVRYAMKC
ncbi:hypothetical protein BDFB_014153, partial [Asbolus verrucosus]